MEFEDDFVKEDIVSFEIDGKMFKYKPTTAGDENEWLNEYMEFIDGKAVQNLTAINKCKMRNLVEVPYSKENIFSVIGENKDWEQLDKDQKWKLLSKLKPKFFDKITRKIAEIDNPNEEVKKN